jgi:hypothetical protein
MYLKTTQKSKVDVPTRCTPQQRATPETSNLGTHQGVGYSSEKCVTFVRMSILSLKAKASVGNSDDGSIDVTRGIML